MRGAPRIAGCEEYVSLSGCTSAFDTLRPESAAGRAWLEAQAFGRSEAGALVVAGLTDGALMKRGRQCVVRPTERNRRPLQHASRPRQA